MMQITTSKIATSCNCCDRQNYEDSNGFGGEMAQIYELKIGTRQMTTGVNLCPYCLNELIETLSDIGIQDNHDGEGE